MINCELYEYVVSKYNLLDYSTTNVWTDDDCKMIRAAKFKIFNIGHSFSIKCPLSTYDGCGWYPLFIRIPTKKIAEEIIEDLNNIGVLFV